MTGTRPRSTYHHGGLPEALLDAAERLVAEKGVAAFSLREAARAIDVDPAACYRHFRDRDDVLHALGRRGFTKLAERMEDAIAHKRSPESKLRALGRTYVEFAIDHAAEFRVMFGPNGLPAFDPRLRGDYTRSPFEIVLDTLRERRPHEGEGIEAQAMSLWAAVHGIASLVIDGGWKKEPEVWAPILKRILDRLI
jgi:AcrR family transcriptional regulator